MVPVSKVVEAGVLEKVSCVLCKVDETVVNFEVDENKVETVVDLPVDEDKVETVVDLSADEVEIEVEVYDKVDEAVVDGNVSL